MPPSTAAAPGLISFRVPPPNATPSRMIAERWALIVSAVALFSLACDELFSAAMSLGIFCTLPRPPIDEDSTLIGGVDALYIRD